MKPTFLIALALSLMLTACGQLGLEGQVIPPTKIPTATNAPVVVVTATPAQTQPPEANATPEATLPPLALETWSSASPNGHWLVEGEYAPDGQGTDHIRLTLKRADGSAQWLLIDRHGPGGLGQYFPKYFYWSPAGRYLYFANESTADGCALFTARHDLYRVDLQAKTPALETLLALEERAWAVALAPDEQSIAYLNSEDGRWVNGRLNIRNILTRQTITEPVTGDATLTWGPVWSPDGAHVALTLASAAETCELKSASVLQLDSATLTDRRVLLSEDTRALETSAWATANVLTLQDRAGGIWSLDLNTGEVAQTAPR